MLMLKYFYEVFFSYDGDDNSTNSFEIGYFSTPKKAREIIEILRFKQGFSEHNLGSFSVNKVGVNFDELINNKSGISLYVLSHIYEDECGYDIWTTWGPFESMSKAIDERNIQMKKGMYKKFIQGFSVSEWKVDKTIEWLDGFCSFKLDN